MGGRTKHVEVKQYFVRDLKDAGIIKVKGRAGEEMTADVLTKNLPIRLFEKHAETFCGDDKYMSGNSQGESVEG